MSKELLRAITDLHNRLSMQGDVQRETRLATLRGEIPQNNANLRSFQPAADTVQLINALHRAVRRDVEIYRPLAEFGLPDEADQQTPQPVAAAPVTRGYVAQMAMNMESMLHEVSAPELQPMLPPAMRHVMALFLNEMRDMADPAHAMSALGGGLAPKLKKVLSAFENQRFGDVQTLLKSALRSDPHHPALLFLLSQFLYYMTSNGHKDARHEAREVAQKAMNFNERLPLEKMAYYRYYCTTAEMLHDPARALMWMREHGMLHVAPMKSPEGLLAQHGILLKCWALLAQIDLNLWAEDEFVQLKELALDVVGGGMIYLAMLAPRLGEAMLGRKDPLPHSIQIEHALVHAYQNYQRLAPVLDRMAEGDASMPWLVSQRYFSMISKVGPRPMFDHVLLHMALNGEHWAAGYPDNELRNVMNEPHASYWRLWALSLCPETIQSQGNQPLDAAPALQEKELLPACGQALDLLREAERERIKPDVWNEVKPWLIRWQMDHLLAAGTGNSQPRDALMPKQAHLRALYRRWTQPQAAGVLASEILYATAQAGAFGSMEEVVAAFQGAFRLLDDPMHGLVATQKRALQAARQQNPDKFRHLSMGGEGIGGGQLLAGLLPLVFIGGIATIFVMSKNIGQAIGLSLALAGFAGVALLGLAKK